ncbi:class I SAM-dependent methyltransferase [Pseudoduganella sp. SL102]|uniref:class I SAM-dependent methyltransferase n=1 Tax=Pseudoduganella sp. SL102 TaxID=2995154 RepID=UPI00248B56BC|nr:class I SAM-dependent methyltransferase [Pseudoduganella sp. SL102]WBS02060.1 class I SAM-dependent methyltransferase [Pseudoduganella sp. SL102]
MSDLFYRAFEDRYRGSREVITGRLRAYLPFLEPLAALPTRAALDLGCGRGEWLELTGTLGFDARGIDLDDGMLSACRERGLNVATGDALAVLRACPDDSVALVSAFHLVEHLPWDMVRDMLREALRVLVPGGLLILETPNPENLSVGASSFYLDPSHLHPIPPALLDFATGFSGFARTSVVRLQENDRARNGGRPRLIDVLEGTSSDYAVVAQKDAPADVMARLDAPFGQAYGVTLGTLAERYDDELERAHQLDRQDTLARADQMVQAVRAELGASREAEHQARAELESALRKELVAHTEQALAHPLHKLADLDWRLIELERRTAEAEQRAGAAEQRIVALVSSSSWRVTAPLRWTSGQVIRARSAVREGRLVPGLKRRALPFVIAAIRGVLQRPRVKHAARRVLRHFPSLQARLYGILSRSNTVAAQQDAPLMPQQPGALSPRAQRIYEQLQLEVQQQAHRNAQPVMQPGSQENTQAGTQNQAPQNPPARKH